MYVYKLTGANVTATKCVADTPVPDVRGLVIPEGYWYVTKPDGAFFAAPSDQSFREEYKRAKEKSEKAEE